MKYSAMALGALLGLSASTLLHASRPEHTPRDVHPPEFLLQPAPHAAPAATSHGRSHDRKLAARREAQKSQAGTALHRGTLQGLERVRQLRETRALLAQQNAAASSTAMHEIMPRQGKPGIEMRLGAADQLPTFMRGRQTPIIKAAQPEDASERETFEAFVAGNKPLFRLEGDVNGLALRATRADRLGKRHYLYQQTVNGVPVRGGQVSAHFDETGGMYALTSRTQRIPADFNTTPAITSQSAITLARDKFSNAQVNSSDANLEIHVSDGRPRLVYAVTSTVDSVNRWKTIIDARTGRVLKHLNDNRHAEVAASGKDLSGATRSFTAWNNGGVNYMIDVTTPFSTGTEDPLNVDSPWGDTLVFDLNNTQGTTVSHVTSGSPNSGWDTAAVSAIHNGQKAYSYFKNAHGRNGIDGNRGNIVLAVHFGNAYDNAFWSGGLMVFGDGGTLFSNLAACADVVGHEMTHGVVEATSGLIYENQSGALNESFADVFGALIEGNNWRIGEGCTKAAPGFLRSLENPHAGLSAQPAHMSEYVYLPNTEAGDRGGVHINSGIPNRAAYLLAEGLSAEGLGKSIGRSKTGALYYRTLTTYLVASSQFIDLRRGMLLAAGDLYPGDTTVENAVKAAFDAVGIIEGGTGTPDDTSPTDVAAGSGADLLFYLYPGDGEVYDGAENFELWMQVLDDPFSGYDPEADIGPLNTNSAAPTRVAAFTDEIGTVVLYVGSDSNLYWNAGGGVEQLTTDGFIYSISTSDDGRFIAYTPDDITDNGIYVVDALSGESVRYELKMTDYLPDAVEGGGRILFADALDFNYLGNRLTFDAFVCVPTADVNCDDASPFGFWTVGVLDVNTGAIRYPFKAQTGIFDIGYPTFAQNNEYIIAFDFIEYLDGGGIGTATFTYNTETGEFPGGLGVDRGVAEPGPEMWGIPAFMGDDEELVFQALIDADHGTGYVRISTVKLELNDDFSFDFGAGGMRMNHYEAAFPVIHRAVYRDFSNVRLTPNKNLLDFGDVEPGAERTLAVTLSNNSAADVVIYQATIDNDRFSHTLVNTRVPRGQSVTGTVTFKAGATEGTSLGTLKVTTDGMQGTLSVPLTAVVDKPSGSGSSGGGSSGKSGGGGSAPALLLALLLFSGVKARRGNK